MTINSATRKAGPFLGDGATTGFPFAFKVFAKGDVQVTLTNTSGVESTLVLDSDYSVAINADQTVSPGGSITYPKAGSPMAAGYKLTVTGALQNLQPTSLPNNGPWYPKTVEDAFDRAVILIQQLGEKVGRAVQFPISDLVPPSVVLPSAPGRANNALGFDANGNPIALPLTIGSVTSPVVANLVLLRAVVKGSAVSVFATGYYTAGDGGGGPYYYDPTDTTSVDNGGTIIVATDGGRWKLQLQGATPTVSQFGAKGIGAAFDDTSAFSAAAASVGANGQVRVPKGTWNLTSNPTPAVTWIVEAGATFVGSGALCVPLNYPSTGRVVKLGAGGTYGHATKIGAQSAWLEAIRVNTEANADLVVLSSIGQGGILGGSQTIDFATPGSMGCIGVIGFGINNNTDQTKIQTAYAGYFEARRFINGANNAGSAQGVEIDIANFGSLVTQTPLSPNNTGISEGFRIASGAGAAGAVKASAAMTIINNGANFDKGIIFQSTALDTTSGEGKAIELFKAHGIVWYSSGGSVVARMRSDAQNAALGIVFTDSNVLLQTMAGANLFSFDTSGNFGLIGAGAVIKNGGLQVIGARQTGWGVASNGSKAAFNGSTATLAQTSAALAQLIADLTTHGLIGA
ncbi:hypothetical protein [Cupriavidus sp. CuC1]|uniref:hypothetical protein n=1 Tax=Cupriavidus sp. CuC1 TaxID=3373131 RepID=UPI0037D702F4